MGTAIDINEPRILPSVSFLDVLFMKILNSIKRANSSDQRSDFTDRQIRSSPLIYHLHGELATAGSKTEPIPNIF